MSRMFEHADQSVRIGNPFGIIASYSTRIVSNLSPIISRAAFKVSSWACRPNLAFLHALVTLIICLLDMSDKSAKLRRSPYDEIQEQSASLMGPPGIIFMWISFNSRQYFCMYSISAVSTEMNFMVRVSSVIPTLAQNLAPPVPLLKGMGRYKWRTLEAYSAT